MTGKVTSVLRRIALIVLAACAVMLYGWCSVLYADTLMPLWWPVGVAVIMAGVTAPFYARSWSRLTSVDSKVVNVLWHLFLMGGVGAFVVLGGNYYGASASSEYTETVTVINRYSETHDTYRRVGRHSRVKNGTRTDYNIRVMFPDSVVRRWPVSLRRYNRIKTGQGINVTMRRGLLGYPVVVDRSI